MDLSGIINVILNPNALVTGLTGGAVGMVALQAYRIVRGMVKPAKYILELYKLADNVVLNPYNRIIDPFLPYRLKMEIQKDIKAVLEQRKIEIDKLIKTISD